MGQWSPISPARNAAKRRRSARIFGWAGVTRAQLFERSQHIEPLRFHDLRATFVTWARRANKDSGWISDRTGHLTLQMLQRYDRGARNLAELQLVPFPEISDAIPELVNITSLRRPR